MCSRMKPCRISFDRIVEVESISNEVIQGMRKKVSLLTVTVMLMCVAAGGAGDTKGVRSSSQAELPGSIQLANEHQVPAGSTGPAPVAFGLPWMSINGGSQQGATSTNYAASYTVAQVAVGEGSSTNFRAGFGFWYGITGLGSPACVIVVTGDVNVNGTITSSDIIAMVNYVFKAGPAACI